MNTVRIHGVALLLVLSSASIAYAQAGTDVVRLVDGSYYRGTIVESTPEHVVLTTLTGEVREFARDQVESEGAATASDTAPTTITPPLASRIASSPEPSEATTHLHARADSDDLSLHRLNGTATVTVPTGRGFGQATVDQFAVVCNLPCDVDIASGTYQLGISRGTGTASRRGRPIELRPGDFLLDVHFEDREGLRIAGWITFIGSAVAALGLVFGALAVKGDSHYNRVTGSSDQDPINVPMAITGAVIFVLGAAIGMPLAFLNDVAELSSEGIRF
ncbi:MAG: hypothetical protein U0234_12655 [Sandaracinus sp.]